VAYVILKLQFSGLKIHDTDQWGRDKQRSRHFSDYVLQIPMNAIQAMRHKVSASCGNKEVIAYVNCLRELYCITVKVQLSSTIH
jgi:hypothetical protein